MFENTPPQMFSLVIFPFADSLAHVNSDSVYNIDSAYDFIMDKIKNMKYSEQFVERMNDILQKINEEAGITLNKHKENLKRNYN